VWSRRVALGIVVALVSACGGEEKGTKGLDGTGTGTGTGMGTGMGTSTSTSTERTLGRPADGVVLVKASEVGATSAAETEDTDATAPIDIDEAIAAADADDVEYALQPTTNLNVVSDQRAYVAAIKEARETRRFDAAVVANEAAAQEEEKRRAGGGPPTGSATAASSTAAASSTSAVSSTGAATSTGAVSSTAPASSAVAASSAPAAVVAPTSQPAPAPTSPPAQSPPPIDESAILSDPHGQWAVAAEASSYYGGDTSPKPRYGAIQATGAPNVPTYSDNALSWTTRSGDSPTPEWITLTYATPIHATAVKIRQSAAPGVVAKIELIEPSGAAHVLWEGIDNMAYSRNAIAWFVRELPRTDFVVNGVRITLQTNRVWGWNEIDAVQLVGTP